MTDAPPPAAAPAPGGGARHHVLRAPGTASDPGAVLVLEVPADDGPPLIVWWGPAAPLAGPDPAVGGAADVRRAVEIAAARAGLGWPLVPEHSQGHYTRPALRGHRVTSGATGPVAGRDWSPRLRTTAVTPSTTGSGLGRLEITAADDDAGVAVLSELEALTGGMLRLRHTVTNTGAGVFLVDGLEVVVPLPDDAAEVLDFTGGHLHERTPQRHVVTDGSWVRENRRGKTGLDATGHVAVGTAGFGFGEGTVRTGHVGWSGNTVLHVERSSSTPATLGGGELLLPGEIALESGASYSSPWLYLAASDRGLDGAAAASHTYLRSLPSHPGGRVPVTLNVWEAVWFDHDLDHLLRIVDLSARVGVERFVLDDGWFGGRRDDTAGLGDWSVSPDAWPTGLDPLVEAVHERGMEFGLWFEPEMVNPDSDLFRAHPDWVLAPDTRTPLLERSQLVLDLSRPEVREHVFEQVHAVLSAVAVDYVKWDHNRDLLEAGGAAVGHAPVVHEQTAGFYQLLDDLRAAHPDVAWESCASGGGRVDLEVLSRTQRVWTSDMTDAVARQSIQRWMLQLAAPELLGAHVSAPVSHQTGRVLPLDLRAATALFGAFGIEWDLTTAGDDELDRLAAWVAVHRRHRELLHTGRTWRRETSDPAVHTHGVVAADRSEALAAVVQLGDSVVERAVPLRVPGLDPSRRYRARWAGPEAAAGTGPEVPEAAVGRAWAVVDPAGPAGGVALPGAVIAEVGLRVPRRYPHSVTLVHLVAEEEA